MNIECRAAERRQIIKADIKLERVQLIWHHIQQSLLVFRAKIWSDSHTMHNRKKIKAILAFGRFIWPNFRRGEGEPEAYSESCQNAPY